MMLATEYLKKKSITYKTLYSWEKKGIVKITKKYNRNYVQELQSYDTEEEKKVSKSNKEYEEIVQELNKLREEVKFKDELIKEKDERIVDLKNNNETLRKTVDNLDSQVKFLSNTNLYLTVEKNEKKEKIKSEEKKEEEIKVLKRGFLSKFFSKK